MKVNFNEFLRKAVESTIEELFENGGEHPCWYCENYGKCNCAHTVTENGETFFDEDFYDDPNGCDNFSADRKKIEHNYESIERNIEEEMEARWYDL